MAKFNVNELNRKMREAQRKLESDLRNAQRKVQQEIKREVDRVNSHNKRVVDDYNRKVEAHNRKVIASRTAQISSYNRRADVHNKQVINEINRRLRSVSNPVHYTDSERALADRVYKAVGGLDPREYDSFLSYAKIDGSAVAGQLRDALETLGVAVWFDEIAIIPGRSQSLQMDAGLRKARTGIALLTPAYLVGRFWTERELGALLSKSTLIPVLHGVTFDEVKQYSGILPDLAGFTTERDSVTVIAEKIAAAVVQ